MKLQSLLFMSTALSSLMFVQPAVAQTSPAPSGDAASAPAATPGQGLGEIVVTAQRRAENVQRAPIAIDSIAADTLAKRNIVDATKLTQIVPSAQIGQAAGAFPVFFLRGGGSFSTNSLNDSAVVVSIDGVPSARQYNVNGQFFDLARVEVLEGPQGTLYGRNATGGAINLIPQHPEHKYSFDGSISYGNYGALIADGAANVPIGQALSARFSFHSSNHDGYASDGTSDDETRAGRVQLAFDNGGPLTLLLSGDIASQNGRGAGFVLVTNGYTADQRVGLGDPRAQAVYRSLGLQPITPQDSYQDNHYAGTKLEANWKTDLGTLTILPAYRHAHLNFSSWYGQGEADNEFDNQSSVEARFTSNDRGFLRWIVGGFYLHDKVDANMLLDFRNGGGDNQIYRSITDSKAVFADLTAKLTDHFRLIGGIRYTDENKSIDGSSHNPFAASPTYIRVDDSAKVSKVTWRAGAQYDVTPSSMLYGTMATGFRSGGFFFTSDNPVYKPEEVTAYTIGSKNRFFNNKLQVNVELFQWQFKQQQIAYLTADSRGEIIFATVNAGKTRERGVEFSTKYQIDRDTQFGVDVQYLDAKFQKFQVTQIAPATNGSLCSSTRTTGGFILDCEGQRPTNAPKWVISPTLSHDVTMPNGAKLAFQAGAHYQSGAFTAIQLTPTDLQKAYITGNASLTYTTANHKWSIGGFVENLGDVAIKTYSAHTAVTAAVLGAPRTYGIRAGVHF